MFMEECKHPESSFKTYFCWQLWGRLQVTHCSILVHSQLFRFLHNIEPLSHCGDLSTSVYSSPATRRRHFDCPIAQVEKKAEHLDIFSEECKKEQLQLSPAPSKSNKKSASEIPAAPIQGEKNKNIWRRNNKGKKGQECFQVLVVQLMQVDGYRNDFQIEKSHQKEQITLVSQFGKCSNTNFYPKVPLTENLELNQLIETTSEFWKKSHNLEDLLMTQTFERIFGWSTITSKPQAPFCQFISNKKRWLSYMWAKSARGPKTICCPSGEAALGLVLLLQKKGSPTGIHPHKEKSFWQIEQDSSNGSATGVVQPLDGASQQPFNRCEIDTRVVFRDIRNYCSHTTSSLNLTPIWFKKRQTRVPAEASKHLELQHLRALHSFYKTPNIPSSALKSTLTASPRTAGLTEAMGLI